MLVWRNIPPVECNPQFRVIIKTFYGEYEQVLVTAKSIQGPLQAALTEYAFTTTTISAYCWKEVDEPLPLPHLQMWDCLSYNIVCVEKTFMRKKLPRVSSVANEFMNGQYLFTLDAYAWPPAETPNEHKSYNFAA